MSFTMKSEFQNSELVTVQAWSVWSVVNYYNESEELK